MYERFSSPDLASGEAGNFASKSKGFLRSISSRPAQRFRPIPPSAEWQAGKNSFSPHPFFFLPACWKPPAIFSGGGWG